MPTAVVDSARPPPRMMAPGPPSAPPVTAMPVKATAARVSTTCKSVEGAGATVVGKWMKDGKQRRMEYSHAGNGAGHNWTGSTTCAKEVERVTALLARSRPMGMRATSAAAAPRQHRPVRQAPGIPDASAHLQGAHAEHKLAHGAQAVKAELQADVEEQEDLRWIRGRRRADASVVVTCNTSRPDNVVRSKPPPSAAAGALRFATATAAAGAVQAGTTHHSQLRQVADALHVLDDAQGIGANHGAAALRKGNAEGGGGVGGVGRGGRVGKENLKPALMYSVQKSPAEQMTQASCVRSPPKTPQPTSPAPPTRKPSTGEPPGILQMRGTMTTEASSSQIVSSSPFSLSWMWGSGSLLRGEGWT